MLPVSPLSLHGSAASVGIDVRHLLKEMIDLTFVNEETVLLVGNDSYAEDGYANDAYANEMETTFTEPQDEAQDDGEKDKYISALGHVFQIENRPYQSIKYLEKEANFNPVHCPSLICPPGYHKQYGIDKQNQSVDEGHSFKCDLCPLSK